jgi:hypothetical protein
MEQGWKKFKAAWNENPLLVIGVSAAAMQAAAKLIDAISGVQSKRAYARNRRR